MSVSKTTHVTKHDHESVYEDDLSPQVQSDQTSDFYPTERNRQYPTYTQLQKMRKARLAAVKAQEIAEGTYQPSSWEILRKKIPQMIAERRQARMEAREDEQASRADDAAENTPALTESPAESAVEQHTPLADDAIDDKPDNVVPIKRNKHADVLAALKAKKTRPAATPTESEALEAETETAAENREAGVTTPSPVTDVNEPQETSASVDRHEMEPFTAASTARPPASLPVARSDYPTAAWGSLAVLVQDVSRCVQVSHAMVGGVLIAVLSTLLQMFFNVSIRAKDGGMPISLNVFLIADSGERKSSTVRAITEPVLAALRKCTDSRRQMLVQDVTVDGLVVALIERHPALFLLVLEAAALFSSHAMSKDNLMRFLGIFSSLFSGEPVSRTRVAEHHYAEDRRLNTLIIGQPAVANEFLSSDLVMKQGLGNRFLYDTPPSLRGSRQYVETELADHPAYQEFCDRVAVIAQRPIVIDELSGGISPTVIRTSPEAKVIWVEHYNQMEEQSYDGGPLATHAGYASRFPEQTLRLAGVLTLVDDIEAREITADAMERAITLSSYYLTRAIDLFTKAPANNDESHAQELLSWMREKQQEFGLDAIPVRMIYKNGPRCARPSKRTRELIAILVERGEIVKNDDLIRYGRNEKSSENYAIVA